MAYKVRVAGKSDGRTYYSLGLPPWMAQRVPAHAGFEPELTAEGILYRYVAPRSDVAPEWTRQ